jgi:predicted MFS family arabinose efflux permease
MRETFPPQEQGTAMAIYSMGVVLAPAMGPVFGGWLTDHFGWPWIFYINMPFSIVGMLCVSAFVEDPPYLRRDLKSIDWLGILLLTVGLTGMQLVLERGQEANWFESPLIVIGTLLTGVLLTALVLWEWRVSEPIMDLRLLRNVPLSVGASMGLVFGVALFGTTFILPQFLQNLLDYNAYQAGLVLLPRSIVLFVLVARRAVFHRVHLVPHVNPLNSAYSSAQAGLTALLTQQHVDAFSAHTQTLALLDATVNRQATMLAYNDVSWAMGLMFLLVFPLLLLLPGRRTTATRQT